MQARLNKFGVDVPLRDIVAHNRAGGNVPALDLAGLDVAGLTAEALGQAPPRQGRTAAERALIGTIASTPAPPAPPAGRQISIVVVGLSTHLYSASSCRSLI